MEGLDDAWVKPGKGGSYEGWVKIRDSYTPKGGTKEQNKKFRKAVKECKGKDQSEFRECMSEQL